MQLEVEPPSLGLTRKHQQLERTEIDALSPRNVQLRWIDVEG
jgi:hypothetical protein